MSVVANVAINVDSSGAVSKLRQVQTQATATQRAFGALQSAIAGIGVASIAAQTLKAAASFNDLQTRLKLLTSEYGEYTQAQQFAAKAAKQFGLSNREAATGVADIYGRLRPLGVSLKDIQSTFNGFNTIARLSGVSAEGASAAFLQLGQALGSGRLQGDEFRSIAEQVPGLLVAVSKETGIAAKDLKQFASDGKLSADIVINALKRIESEGAGKIASLVQNSDTQKFKDLQNAVDDLSVAVGNELLPVVTPLIKDLTSLVGTIAALPDPVKNATGEIVKLIIQLILVEKAIKAIIALNAAFVAAQVAMAGATATTGVAATTSAGAFALYTNNTRALQAQAATATPVLNGLLGTLGRLAAIGTIAIVVNVAVTGMAAVLQAQAEIDKLRGVRSKGGATAAFGGSATAEQKKAQQETLAAIKKERASPEYQMMQAGAAAGVGKTMARQRADQLAERERSARAVLALPLRNAAATPKPTPTPNAMGTPIGSTVGGGTGKGTGKGENDAERKAEEKRRATEELANLQGQVTLKEKLFGIDKQIAAERQRGSLVTATALEMDKAIEERQARIAEITRSKATQETKNAQIKETTLDADQKIYAVQQAIKEQEAERTKSFDAIIADLDLELALKTATTEQAREQLRLEAEIAKLKGQGFTPEEIGAITAKKTELAAPKTDQQNITDKIGKLKDEIADLTSISNIAITSAEGIGNAFAQSFQGLISGTMTAKEALGSFFKSVADMFLEMAAQIIAKQITMIVLQTILQALGAISGGGIKGAGNAAGAKAFGGSGPKFNPGAFSMPKLAGRAVGGPVISQQPYMVGERGPELFVPGSNGGVMSNNDLRSAMNSQGGSAGSPVLNMSFESTTINGVEYVSRDQLEQAMAETRRASTRDGAQRGMTMTLDRIQNSSSTRRRIGV